MLGYILIIIFYGLKGEHLSALGSKFLRPQYHTARLETGRGEREEGGGTYTNKQTKFRSVAIEVKTEALRE